MWKGFRNRNVSRGARIADRTVWPFFGPAVEPVGAPRLETRWRRALLSFHRGRAITAVKTGRVARVLFVPQVWLNCDRHHP